MENETLLETLYKECKNELEKIGIIFSDKKIQVQLSKRNNKRYGCCKPQIPDPNYKRIKRKGFSSIIIYENYKQYTIEISPWVMKLNPEIIKNTLFHELLHCMPYCLNHGKEFKKYAKLIYEQLGYSITTTGNKKEDYQKSNLEYEENLEHKYKIYCVKCGQVFYRKRLNKNFTKYYRCGKCKGKLKIVKKN